MTGIILVDKPSGLTSFDIVRLVRRKLNVKKVGHAGTLDPMATGLMIIGVGSDTKKLKEYVGLDKVYVADVLLGQRTETGDLEGNVVEEVAVPEWLLGGDNGGKIAEGRVAEVLEEMVGSLRISAPIYSALKRGGEPLYRKARRGEKVNAPQVDMDVLGVRLLGLETVESTPATIAIGVRWHVSSGTYIRSLAEELGRRLGTVATLRSLTRTKVGDYRIEDAIVVDNV